jgi:hypothetical protein
MKRKTMAASKPTPAADRITSTSDNVRQYITTDELRLDHASSELAVAELERFLSEVPEHIDSDEVCGTWQDNIKTAQDAIKNLEAKRIDAKAPFLAAERTVDGFFQELKQKALRVQAAMSHPVSAYLQAKAAAERARREAEAKRLRDEEEAKRLEALEQQRKADAARREQTRALAEQRAAQAEEEARQRAAQAEQAEKDAQAKPAEMARTRSSAGSLGTLKREWDFTILDIDAVKGAPIWAFIKREHKEMAIRAYMRANAPKDLPQGQEWQPLAGVRFYQKEGLQVR